MSPTEIAWISIGFFGQLMFFMRFFFQWLHSERARRSVLPEIFWYFSFAGGATLLTYAIYRADPVFILGQSMGLFVYSRNIYFVWREKRQKREEPVEDAIANRIAS
ncbi:MAG: lipid A biosynthesis [Alphaproteobacteria bacterium]|nr:lipid A biosynthesis [Alphaproteobacteria bacterium]